ncbi:response regulator containing a CheY-like receiver domain and an HTH DNA-binding domain [Methylophilaceae bacterium 11]|jgi:DNA-binding CsgD family transcriptional regulator|uniref:helix-turn-helix transcriptional regulator n=1 Tax=Methylotenera sp. 1P/1 TaxID=1131551 RepID=UPI00036CC239|nr:helix-turn-helix transcriptional regulator [Methylotenera sp. 1P/1]EUJ11510.1 response regulator containing a CheY-like receiver domain and an HTH DNA-binding domain [Methylophilaceae bacterium 11]
MSATLESANQQLWQAKLLEQGLEQLGQAMLIVSSRGEVVFSSKAAESILAADRGLKLKDSQLVADLAADNKRLQDAVDAAIKEQGACNVFNVYVHRNDYVRPISLTISKMSKNDQERRHGHHVLILIKDLNLNQEFWADRLKDEYRLSPREVQCVSLLSEGRDLKDVAELMGIGIETVRQYMKNIYKKMGVHKQHELVSLALEYRRNR